jgi:hypothetical protein
MRCRLCCFVTRKPLSSSGTIEILIRMALGADRRAVLALVLQGGVWMASIGVLDGAGLAFVLARIARGLLFGVTPHDPGDVPGVGGAADGDGSGGCVSSGAPSDRVEAARRAALAVSYRLARGSYGSACASGCPGAGSPRRPGCGSLAPSGMRGPRLTFPLRISLNKYGTSSATANAIATRMPISTEDMAYLC